MSASSWWRKLSRGYSRDLTISLHSYDQMDLWSAILDLSDEGLTTFGWTREQRIVVMDALNAYSVARYKQGTIVDDEMVPISLPRDDWRRIAAFCSIYSGQTLEKWPGRVIVRVAAETFIKGR